jgi:hypothetical protein
MRSLSKIQISQSRAFVSLRRRPQKFHCQFSQIYFTIVYKKKNYLESTLELLQQFYIKLADHSKTFKIWVGDLHKYCLHCTRCHRAITIPDYIEGIMEMAPIAMLWHMGMASGINDYHHCPFVLPNQESMYNSCTQFEDSREKIDAKQPSPFLQCNASTNQGMI